MPYAVMVARTASVAKILGIRDFMAERTGTWDFRIALWVENRNSPIYKPSSKNIVNTSQLSSGVHFLKITTSEGVFHKNFTKK